MKKQAMSMLVALTLIFSGFTAGYFLGRSHSPGSVQLSVPPALTAPAPKVAETLPATEPQSAETEPGETEPAPTQATEPPVTFPIDLNTADARELMALPGIGEVLAGRILAYRQDHGPFEAVEELMNVSGIGEKRLEAVLDLVTIGG